MSEKLKSIAIVLNSYFGPLMVEICKELKKNHDVNIHLYCKSDVLVKQYMNGEDSELFSSVTNFMKFQVALRDDGLDKEAVLAEAKSREERYDITYNTLAVSNRHVGRGYALGGFYHPGSRYGKASYLHMVHAYNVQLGFWEHEFEKKGVTLVLADNKEIALVAGKMGVVYRSVARARYKNFHYWEEAETREADAIQREFSKLPDRFVEGESESLPPYMAGKEIIRRAMKRASLWTAIRQSVYLLARQAWWVYKGYEKAKGYYVSEQIRQTFRQWRDIRRMLGPETVGLEELENTPFIFYPLHTEPEQSLGQISPEFFFQLAAIAALSRDLPVGTRLAIKDVPMACGRRPDNFYDQVLRMKNVVILNVAIPGQEVIKRAVGVATIAGTAGLEAALLGKPVVSFGRHNPYNFLGHVKVNFDLGELPKQVKWLFDNDIDQKKARGDAEKFIESVKQASFDMGEFNYFDLEKFAQDAPQEAYKLLIESLK